MYLNWSDKPLPLNIAQTMKILNVQKSLLVLFQKQLGQYGFAFMSFYRNYTETIDENT